MSRIIWIGAWIGVAFWSFWSWVASGMLGVFGGAARRATGYTPGFPVEPLSAAWFADVAHDLGFWAILFVWSAGTAVLLGAAFVVTRFVGRRRAPPSPERRQLGLIADRLGFKSGRKLKKVLD